MPRYGFAARGHSPRLLRLGILGTRRRGFVRRRLDVYGVQHGCEIAVVDPVLTVAAVGRIRIMNRAGANVPKAVGGVAFQRTKHVRVKFLRQTISKFN